MNMNRGILGSNGTIKTEERCKSEDGGGGVIAEMSDKMIS